MTTNISTTAALISLIRRSSSLPSLSCRQNYNYMTRQNLSRPAIPPAYRRRRRRSKSPKTSSSSAVVNGGGGGGVYTRKAVGAPASPAAEARGEGNNGGGGTHFKLRRRYPSYQHHRNKKNPSSSSTYNNRVGSSLTRGIMGYKDEVSKTDENNPRAGNSGAAGGGGDADVGQHDNYYPPSRQHHLRDDNPDVPDQRQGSSSSSSSYFGGYNNQKYYWSRRNELEKMEYDLTVLLGKYYHALGGGDKILSTLADAIKPDSDNNNPNTNDNIVTMEAIQRMKRLDEEMRKIRHDDDHHHGDENSKRASTTSTSSSPDTNKTENEILPRSTNEIQVTLEQLCETERAYRDLCVLYQQLVSGWASLRPPLSTSFTSSSYNNNGDEEDKNLEDGGGVVTITDTDSTRTTISTGTDRKGKAKNTTVTRSMIPSSAEMAESYLDSYERLRSHREMLIRSAREVEEEKSQKEKSTKEKEEAKASNEKTLYGTVKKFLQAFQFGGPGTNVSNESLVVGDDDGDDEKKKKERYHFGPDSIHGKHHGDGGGGGEEEEEEEKEQRVTLTAHKSPEYVPTARMYRKVMKAFIAELKRGSGTMSPAATTPEYHDLEEHEDDDSYNTNIHVGGGGGGGNSKGKPQRGYTANKENQNIADRLTKMYNKMIDACVNNPSVRPDRSAVRTVLTSYAAAGSLQYAILAEGILREMMDRPLPPSRGFRSTGVEKSASNEDGTDATAVVEVKASSKKPATVDWELYHYVLKAYRSAAAKDGGGKRRSRRKAALRAEQLLAEMERIAATMRRGRKKNDDETGSTTLAVLSYPYAGHDDSRRGPNLASYSLVLHAFVNAGHKSLPDLCERVDRLMERFMGKEAFQALLSQYDRDESHTNEKNEEAFQLGLKEDRYRTDASNVAPQNTRRQPDMHLLHQVLELYATSNKRPYLEKAKRLLRHMEQIREEQSYRGKVQNISEYRHPDTYTYNAVIRGLLHSHPNLSFGMEEEMDEYTMSKGGNVIGADAIYATELLDTMVRYQSSRPSRNTFHHLFRLWAKTKEAQAGERAEEILSRMEVCHACSESHQDDTLDRSLTTRPDRASYQAVLDCWAVAASAGYSGAAHRALLLLDKMEAQCAFVLNDPIRTENRVNFIEHVYNESVRPTQTTYTTVIKTCAQTRLDSDKAEALRIAFDVYNRMIDRGVHPNADTYGRLLLCCANLLTDAAEHRMVLAKQVFEAACEQGQVSKKVLSALRKANLPLHESYKHKPNHSANSGARRTA